MEGGDVPQDADGAALSLDEMVSLLRAHPERSAILSDLDGTLVSFATGPKPPELPLPVKSTLRRVQAEYKVVGIVTGRRVRNVQKVVGVKNLYYSGNFGFELLRPGKHRVEILPAFRIWRHRIRRYCHKQYRQLRPLGIFMGDKGSIFVFTWVGSKDEVAAHAALDRMAEDALARGLGVQKAKGSIEIIPPVHVNKGTAVKALIDAHPEITQVLYAGDDCADIAVMNVIKELVASGRLTLGVRIAVNNAQTPPEVVAAANAKLNGISEMAEVLAKLAL